MKRFLSCLAVLGLFAAVLVESSVDEQCEAYNKCSGHGVCGRASEDEKYACYCYEEWDGDDNCTKPPPSECPHDCNNHGDCENGICTCHDGWQGDDCSKEIPKSAKCPKGPKGVKCSGKGACTKGKCKCDSDYHGDACEIPNCPTGSGDKICSGRGKCDGEGKCHCLTDYWSGIDCSIPKCPSFPNCTFHGACVGPDKCECFPGWDGSACNTKKCPQLCENHGRCNNGTCVCAKGWTNFDGGNSCAKMVCPEDCNGHGKCGDHKCHCVPPYFGDTCAEKKCINACSKHGECKENGECDCQDGFWGEACEKKNECPGDCNGHGKCVNSKCECATLATTRFGGDDCSKVLCINDSQGKSCSGHGTCEDGICKCDSNYFGPACKLKACPKSCSSHGTCNEAGKCACLTGWKGEACDERFVVENHGIVNENGDVKCFAKYTGDDCGELKCPMDCSNKGVCEKGECACYQGWSGAACQLKECPNLCWNHGECKEDGTCECDEGYQGEDCGTRYVQHGHCDPKTETCTCDSVPESEADFEGQKWTGDDCSKRTCPNRDCGGKGVCNDGQCACTQGYTGHGCEIKTCPKLCSGQGVCINGKCTCLKGFQGDDCNTPNALAKSDGVIDPDDLVYYPGNATPAVNTSQTPSLVGEPSKKAGGVSTSFLEIGSKTLDNGTSIVNKDLASWTSSLPEKGGEVQLRSTQDGGICPGNCNGHGHCDIKRKVCVCDTTPEGEVLYEGPGCETAVCPGKCSGHGTCEENSVCTCEKGYAGLSCRYRMCPNQCSHRGFCGDGRCVCDAGYGGDDCSEARSSPSEATHCAMRCVTDCMSKADASVKSEEQFKKYSGCYKTCLSGCASMLKSTSPLPSGGVEGSKQLVESVAEDSFFGLKREDASESLLTSQASPKRSLRSSAGDAPKKPTG